MDKLLRSKSSKIKNKVLVQKKINKKRNEHKSLDGFYSPEEKHRQKIEIVEDEIFQHLKNHTKKILKK